MSKNDDYREHQDCGCIVGPLNPLSYCYSMLRSPQINAKKIRSGLAKPLGTHALHFRAIPGRFFGQRSGHPSCSGLPGLLRKITGCHFKTHKKPMEVTDVDWKSQWHTTVQYDVQYSHWKSRLEQQLPREWKFRHLSQFPTNEALGVEDGSLRRASSQREPMEDMVVVCYCYSILSLIKKNQLNRQ